MPPTTRSSPNSINARIAEAQHQRRKSSSDSVTNYSVPSPENLILLRERTKRGCWTCRIRRKKCDEEQIDGRCKTCRRLCLDCLGWGSKRPDWMKDKKAVDAKKAEIKQQLARQGMIRGQARTQTAATTAGSVHHQRNSSASSQRATYLNIPGLQRSTDSSRRTSSSPSPSSNTAASSSGSASVPIRTRPERLAKTQAKAALRISPEAAEEASGNSDEDEEVASGSEDGGNNSNNNHRLTNITIPSTSTTMDVDHPMSSAAGIMKDLEKLGGVGGFPEVPKLFDSASTRGPASSTATPSFPNSPLHVPGGLADLDGSFSATFSIHGFGNGSTSLEGIMDDPTFGGFGSGLPDLSTGAEDPYGPLDLFAGGGGIGVAGGFDFIAATYASNAIAQAQQPKDHHPSTMTIPIPPRTTLTELEIVTAVGAVRPDSISPPILTATTTPGGGSSSGSPLVGTNPSNNHHNNNARRQSIPAIGMTVTSSTGITLPAAFSNPSAFTGGMIGGPATDSSSSYFPSQPITTSPPPVATVQTSNPSAPSSAATTPGLIPINNRARSKTAGPALGLSSSTPSSNLGTVAGGFYPQPAQAFPAPLVPNATQQQTTTTPPAFGTFTISYKPQIRAPLADPNRSLSSFQETLVFYYFNRGVRRMQYLLADDSTTGVTDVMYDLVIRDPLGPVTNAICSLSSLHDTRLRIAHGQLHPEDPHAHDIAQKLYSDTVLQLAKKAGKFTAVEAIASLHLLSFWLFCGGGGDWNSALGMAGDWLMGTEVMKDGNDPVEILEKWPPVQRFAAQAILWFDVLGSCSLRKAPRFIKLYNRMSDRNQKLAMVNECRQPSILFNQRKPTGAPSELMNQVMGCDDDIMFALAKIADLAAWKDQQEAAQSLSVFELAERARVIEQELKSTRQVVSPLSTSGPTRPSASAIPSPGLPAQASTAGFTKTAPPVWDPYNVSSVIPQTSEEQGLAAGWGGDASRTRSASMNSPSPPIGFGRAASASSSSVTGAPGPLSIITTAEPVTLRQLSSNVFREAAFLFLYSVVSGAEPNVKEVQDSVNSLINSILAIPSTDLDRSLAFPITIGGCLAATAEQRSFFADRLAAQGSAVGNGSQAKLLMETVWKRRDSGERRVCWRDTMKTLQFDLLLV